MHCRIWTATLNFTLTLHVSSLFFSFFGRPLHLQWATALFFDFFDFSSELHQVTYLYFVPYALFSFLHRAPTLPLSDRSFIRSFGWLRTIGRPLALSGRSLLCNAQIFNSFKSVWSPTSHHRVTTLLWTPNLHINYSILRSPTFYYRATTFDQFIFFHASSLLRSSTPTSRWPLFSSLSTVVAHSNYFGRPHFWTEHILRTLQPFRSPALILRSTAHSPAFNSSTCSTFWVDQMHPRLTSSIHQCFNTLEDFKSSFR